jgi:hypothetical protein
MSALNDWDIVDANNNAAPPDGWPENTMQYSEVNNTGRAVQGTLKRFFADVNGSLDGAGSVNAYTLTLNEPYVAYFDGMYFACSIPATNTGAVTINVNAIGVQSVVNRDGSALVGGELDNAGIYEFRYDGTNFQLMGTIGSAFGTAQLTATNSNAPDLVDTDVALRVGAIDPDAAQHLEFGPQDIQSKSSDTVATNLRLQAAGGIVEMYGGGAQVHSVGDTDAELRLLVLTHEDGTARGFFGHNGADILEMRNQIDSGHVILSGLDTGSVARTMLQGDPDGDLSLFHPPTADVRMTMQAAGIAAIHSDGSLDTEVRTLQFRFANGTLRGEIGHASASGILEIVNRIHGQNIEFRAETLGGTERKYVEIDPDDNVVGGWGRFAVWEDGAVFPLLLVGEPGGNVNRDTSASVRDIQGVERPVGFVLSNPSLFSTNVTLDEADFMQRTLYHDEGITRVFDIPVISNTDLSAGVMMGIVNFGTGGVQIRPATTVVVEWFDGSVYNTLTGNGSLVVTCPTGRFSLWRISSTLYELVGPGIT